MRVEPIPVVYESSSQAFRMTVHLICMFLVMPTFPGRVCHQRGLPQTSFEITLLWTPIVIEEWGSRATRVIGKEEEEGISLSQYEDRYKALFRDIATLTEHDEGVMQELRTAYLDEDRSSTDEVASLHAERDSAVEERDSIAEDFEHLRQNFDRMVAERDSLRDELERVRLVPFSSFVAPTLPGPSLDRIRDLERRVDRYRSERNSTKDECHELKEDVKGLMDRCGRLSGLLLAVGGNPSLANVNPYVRVPLPSSVQSQSQSQACTQMTRGLRRVRLRLEGEASSRTAGVEEDSISIM
ncbi:hypothetical protein AMTR_s00034p00225090 [Amborella trichopoda]|uniref:Uncharacterized protein n=1 Tax=Amborella trichopoda TaxID=13333 RepID=W1PQE8_AMBTC|nr:hypothetical protein AMTR_s00034p00225090 [Amborella trichopoda]